jgi:membrane-associated protein
MSFLTHAVSASPATYAVVFAVVAVDAVFPFVQAEAVVITAAVLAARGGLSIWILIPVVALAGLIGDNAAYGLGTTAGRRIARRFFGRGRRKQRLEQAKKGIRGSGSLLIVVARFLPVGRTLTTLAAGTLKMPWLRFLAADAIAAAAWSIYANMLGYVGGSSFQHSLWKPLVFALGLAFLLGVAVETYRRIQKRRGRELMAGEFR